MNGLRVPPFVNAAQAHSFIFFLFDFLFSFCSACLKVLREAIPFFFCTACLILFFVFIFYLGSLGVAAARSYIFLFLLLV
jgi:hypothetical protein